MRIRFLEIAQIELDEAIEYYNYESPRKPSQKAGLLERSDIGGEGYNGQTHNTWSVIM